MLTYVFVYANKIGSIFFLNTFSLLSIEKIYTKSFRFLQVISLNVLNDINNLNIGNNFISVLKELFKEE